MKHINRLGKDKLVSVVDIQTILEWNKIIFEYCWFEICSFAQTAYL
jgi:hypothetical protein